MNTIPKYSSANELLEIAKQTSGHRISEYNINNRSLAKNNKGVIGQIIEEGVFHYPPNSRPEADFADLGVELKVTGLKKLKNNEYVAKERLVLNIIDYMLEYNIPFEDSTFWKKNMSLLLMFYLYEEKEDFDFYLIDSILHSFSQEDLEIIKYDWQLIVDKINNGLADTLSEADTMYLGACTKGKDAASSYRKQPASDKLAKQRAYCLKPSYINTIINKNLIGEKCKSIVSFEELKNSTFEAIMDQKLKPYYGMSEVELFEKFGIPNNPALKSRFNVLTGAMLGFNGHINNTDEFRKANLELKTIRIEENGKIKEHMSFPTFKYIDIAEQTWESSELREKFDTTKYMFVVFKKKNGVYYLDKIKFWNMPLEILDKEVKETWEYTQKIIKSGDIVNSYSAGKYFTNFPGSTFNHICHVRPHDSTGIDKSGGGYILPVPDKKTGLAYYTKHCFWLDRSFILSIINDVK